MKRFIAFFVCFAFVFSFPVRVFASDNGVDIFWPENVPLSLDDDSTTRFISYPAFSVRRGSVTVSVESETRKQYAWSSGSSKVLWSYTSNDYTTASLVLPDDFYVDFEVSCAYMATTFQRIDFLGNVKSYFWIQLSPNQSSVYPWGVQLLVNGVPYGPIYTEDDGSGGFTLTSGQIDVTEDITYLGYRFFFYAGTTAVTSSQGQYPYLFLYWMDDVTFTPVSGSSSGVDLTNIESMLEEIAQQLQYLATESTLDQCYDAVSAIYAYLSGNIYPLLQQIETNQDTLYTFLSSNMLPQIVTQLSNLKASVDTGFDNTIAAIEAQTQALISYLDEAFSEAGESIEDTNQSMDSAIGSYDEAEDALVGDFNAQWAAFDFNSFMVDATLGNAFTWVSARFVDLWNALGGEVQLLVTIPCVLGVGMMVVTGSSRFFGRASRSQSSDADE